MREVNELRQLRYENARIKRLVVDLTLDSTSRGGRQKKALKPTRRRSLANWMPERFQVAVIRSCRLAGLSHAARYERCVAKDQSALRMRIRDIAHRRPRADYQRIPVMLRRGPFCHAGLSANAQTQPARQCLNW